MSRSGTNSADGLLASGALSFRERPVSRRNSIAVRSSIRRPAVAGLTLCALLLGTSACVETFDARSLGARTSLSARATEQPQGEPFKVNKTAVFMLWGIATATTPSLDRVLAVEITGDAEIANLKITSRSRFSDFLITVLTAGLIVPRTITYEGIIVKPPAATQ